MNGSLNEERLFLAVGAADPELLERSSRARTAPAVWKWGLFAACICLFCAAGLLAVRRLFPVSPPEGREILSFTNGDAGVLHLMDICYEETGREEFFLYINEERYYGAWEDGSYVIRPITPTPEGLPECDLTVSHWGDTSMKETAELIRSKMSETYSMVLPPEEYAGQITLTAYNGTESGAEWDAANVRITVTDDQEGGVFTLTARFFTEAAEGLGADFAGMADTFRPIPADSVVPAWLESLREALDTLLSAAFSNNWTEAENLLAGDVRISSYQEDVSDQVSISAVDISPDGVEDPAAAVVSVRHRLSAEEAYGYLIIELSQINGQWKARLIELEPAVPG
ncbi:MAG: hypothetical protein K2O18_00545 [Oscillospiraceae bacterium]|nr:hypothetical protein [Oscillospiraceae bacterium]